MKVLGSLAVSISLGADDHSTEGPFVFVVEKRTAGLLLIKDLEVVLSTLTEL